MTAESPTRRTVLTTGVAAAGAAAGTVALAACAGGSTQSGSGSGGQPAPAAQPAAGTTIASLSDVPVGGAKSVTIGGQAAIVARPSENNVVAFSASCTHQHCTVNLSGDKLKCPCHGSQFNALTGAVEHPPAKSPLPSIPVKVDNGKIVSA
ncbi:Rieske (2Fe-2S) protein [Amycolatopsis pigmentata]|uniref:Cytochrome bc1 complex Rieske iron-sulfur subunit n=1 Tax=Amycolatopsis pigmentata TaxID=450801 RepID=A0ABW5G5Q3_9PSEU